MASYSDMANSYLPLKDGESVPTDADYTNWMTEGLQHIINVIPTDMLWMFETSATDAAEDGVSVGTNKIMYVQRESDSNLVDSNGDGTNDAKMLVECREVPASLRGRITPGSGYQEEASETDPVWYKLGGKVFMFPSSAEANSKVYWILNPPVGMTGNSTYLAGTSGIPLEVDPLVLSYSIYKALCKVHSDLIIEQRDDIKDLHSSITDIDTAIGLGKDALARIKLFVWDNSTSEYAFTKVTASINRAELLISDYSGFEDLEDVNDASATEIFSAIKMLEEEETDLLQGVIALVQAELSKAQIDSAQIDQIMKTAIAEAQSHFGEASARLGIIQSKLQEYQMNSAQRQAVSQSIMAASQKFDREFKDGLMMLVKGSYEEKTMGDQKDPPTYSGMAD